MPQNPLHRVMNSRRSSIWLTALGFITSAVLAPSFVQAAPLAVAPVRAGNALSLYVADGVVEALRQTVISAQVSGAIVALPVKAGDTVTAGQTLLRIDARAANQEANASHAQVEAARAALAVAAKDFERQKQLFAKQYISQSSLDRAESVYQTSSAQARAQIAQASAVQTQSGFYSLSALYAGIVAEIPTNLGGMATPGSPLMTLYDPASLRVTANVPQARIAALAAAQAAGQPVMLEFPNMPEAQRWIRASKVTILPVADAVTHTVQVRLDLPAGSRGLTPGMFARANLPMGVLSANLKSNTDGLRLYVPVKAVFRRAELTAVYVLNAQGQALLRQVKAGAVIGAEQEILSGVSSGEQVALDPVAAAQVRFSTP